MPFNESFFTLEFRPLSDRIRDNILYDTTHAAFFGPQKKRGYNIVLGSFFLSHGKHRFRLGNFSPSENFCKMLPKMKRVRIFPACASSALPISKIRLPGTRKPWMSRKNSSPVFPEFHINGYDFPEHFFLYHSNNRLNPFGNRVIISNSYQYLGILLRELNKIINPG